MAQMKISEFGEKKVDDFFVLQSKVVEELDANLYLCVKKNMPYYQFVFWYETMKDW